MKLEQTRRGFLLGGSALALCSFAFSGTSTHAQSVSSTQTEVAIPPVYEGTVLNGVRNYDLSLQNGKTEFFKGFQTKTSGINGSFLGPVLRMRSGETVQMRVTNNLGHDSTLHWHGMNVPAKADGGPHQVIKPNQTWSPQFMIHEKASTMWYHSHLMHETAPQVWSGLAGMIIIDDEEADALDLPSEYGVDDIPLVLQDRRFQSDGSMPYETSRHDQMAGMSGDTPLINGTVQP
ncbi:MAG: multicopper oxidase domain-containing protein, partial [Marinosulfonomonas sp.]|nr:multicopper oxidase domain-containing protein [Marinosulfonomonas sp.]